MHKKIVNYDRSQQEKDGRQLADELSQSAPADKHTSLHSKQSVKKAYHRDVFENNDKALWCCADQTVNLNLRGLVYFVFLNGLSYQFPGEM